MQKKVGGTLLKATPVKTLVISPLSLVSFAEELQGQLRDRVGCESSRLDRAGDLQAPQAEFDTPNAFKSRSLPEFGRASC